MNRKLHQLFQPSLQLYFVCLVVFALASALFSLPLAALELVVVALLGLYHRANLSKRRREVTKYIENITGTVDVAAKDTMVNSPLPMVIFRPESGDIIWTNDRFLKLTDDGEHLFDAKLSAVIPGFDTRWLLEGKNECPGDVAFAGRRFLVYGHLVRASERGGGFLATTYWVDVTELSAVRDRYQASRPVAAVLLLDNYEDLMKNLTENQRSTIYSEINARLDAGWTGPAGCCGGWSGTGTSSSLRSSTSPGSWIRNSTSWTPSTRWSTPAACPPPCPSAWARTAPPSRS